MDLFGPQNILQMALISNKVVILICICLTPISSSWERSRILFVDLQTRILALGTIVFYRYKAKEDKVAKANRKKCVVIMSTVMDRDGHSHNLLL